jgi:hypothetical protein
MKKRSVTFVIAAGIAAAAQSQELIRNGSFENPVIAAPFVTVTAGSPTLTDWIVGRTSIDIVSTPFNPTYPSRDGDQHVDLAGSPGPGSIQQFFTTVPGTQYYLRFSASSNGTSRLFEVFWEGFLLTTPAAPNQGTWQDFEFVLNANSTNGMVGFGSADTGFQGALIDRVSVQAVPEPASFAALGLGAAWLARRRRKGGSN